LTTTGTNDAFFPTNQPPTHTITDPTPLVTFDMDVPPADFHDTASITNVGITRPPAEPPLGGLPDTDIELLLDCIPPADRTTFATQFIANEIAAIESNPPAQQRTLGNITRLVMPSTRRHTPSPLRQRQLIKYNVPLEKARSPDPPCFPQGSVMDPSILIRMESPRTPFEFPFDMPTSTPVVPHMDTDFLPFAPMDSVTRVVGLPRVCGLKCESDMVARVTRLATALAAADNPSLMDGGANICITGILSLLVDVETITPLPISAATTPGSISLDDCCTKQGLLLLTLADGSAYCQLCYYCKNATEMIISPEAIVAASDTVHWTQTGHKGTDLGSICFSSDSGLYSITISLEKRDGLYYCPTDVFTVDRDPVRPSEPIIRRAVAPIASRPPGLPWRQKRYTTVTRDRLTESELWMLQLGLPGEDQLDLLPGNVTGVPPGFHYHPFRFLD
jgi:hypothetical protein